MDMTKNSILIGEAGNLRVRSELLLRDLATAVADVDTGTDIFLIHSKKTIQVKTCLHPWYNKQAYSWSYNFAIRAAKFRNGKKGFYRQIRRRVYEVDFFVLWCVKDNLFYIIPASKIGERINIVIATPDNLRTYKKHTWKKSKSKYEKYKNNWNQLL